MKAQQGKQKQSRNRARKALYAAQADASSRNQSSIGNQPIIGHFEEVTEEKVVVTDDETGEVVRVFTKQLARPYKRIVHDGPKSDAPATDHTPKRTSDARKRRRQEAAWARCAAFRAAGEHSPAPWGNCGCCGCPPSEVQVN